MRVCGIYIIYNEVCPHVLTNTTDAHATKSKDNSGAFILGQRPV